MTEKEEARRQKRKEYNRKYRSKPQNRERSRQRAKDPKTKEAQREWHKKRRQDPVTGPILREKQKLNARRYRTDPIKGKKIKTQEAKKHRLPKHKLQKYKKNAEKRGLKWALSDEQAMAMFDQDCYYCDITTFETGELTGIDRVDNNNGYETSNVVPCCNVCNTMKMDYSVEQFVEKCKRVTENMSKKKQKTTN